VVWHVMHIETQLFSFRAYLVSAKSTERGR
jgi:hypothetical protein